MAYTFGKTLLIVNPTAQSGRGQAAAEIAQELLGKQLGKQLEVATTQYANHALEIARDRGGEFDTVITLGGDGVIHETVNGLMQVAADQRPAFGIIPFGSGNDFAKSLRMKEDAAGAVAQLLESAPHYIDLGLVNGQYYTETLSAGLCAAIALGTTERRKRTGQSGTILYASEGVDQLLHHMDFHPFHIEAELEDGSQRTIEGSAIVVAMQNGATFGGGFKICPDARIDDGLIDVCIVRGPVAKPLGALMFLSAKNGGHRKFKRTEIIRVRSMTLRFDDAPKCQIDGEALNAEVYHVSAARDALRVLVPQEFEQ